MKRTNTSEERITKVNTQAFKQYLKEIYNLRPLDAEEEHQLCVRMLQGDEAAREKVIKHNLRFVVSVAKQYYTTGSTLEDLVNEGNYGLIIASHKFDPTRGFKFITYAVWWIKNAIIKFINTKDSIVRLPNHKLHNINKLKDGYMEVEQSMEKTPTIDDVVSHFKGEYTREEVDEFFKFNFSHNQHFDSSISDDGNGKKVIDDVENDIFPNSDSLIEEDDSTRRVKNILKHLNNEKQYLVITKILGLDGNEPLPIEVVSREMGLTKERVRQIKMKSLLLLRKKLEVNGIYS